MKKASKKEREIIFNKFGGKCAYCGEDLKKGWHVDEMEPVIRKQKTVDAGWYSKETGERISRRKSIDDNIDVEWRGRKNVADGCYYPERFNIDNQMPSCPSCNINKHSDSLEEFRRMVQHFTTSLNRDSTQYKIAKRYGLVIETDKKVVFHFETFK